MFRRHGKAHANAEQWKRLPLSLAQQPGARQQQEHQPQQMAALHHGSPPIDKHIWVQREERAGQISRRAVQRHFPEFEEYDDRQRQLKRRCHTRGIEQRLARHAVGAEVGFIIAAPIPWLVELVGANALMPSQPTIQCFGDDAIFQAQSLLSRALRPGLVVEQLRKIAIDEEIVIIPPHIYERGFIAVVGHDRRARQNVNRQQRKPQTIDPARDFTRNRHSKSSFSTATDRLLWIIDSNANCGNR